MFLKSFFSEDISVKVTRYVYLILAWKWKDPWGIGWMPTNVRVSFLPEESGQGDYSWQPGRTARPNPFRGKLKWRP